MDFDIVIIGGGPGGYVTAIRAAQLKLKTALIEREHLGGICLNWGCIPTKALLRSAEVYHLAQHASDYGVEVGKVSYDFKKIITRSREISKKLAAGIGHLMKKNNITVLTGTGKLLGAGKIEVALDGKKQEVTAKHIVIATGARAREIPTLKPDGKNIWTYKEAMTPDALPKSLMIVGSGAIGMEFASFYNMMGTDVTVIEAGNKVLRVEDDEISTFALKSFEQRGIKFMLNTEVASTKTSKDGLEVTLKSLANGQTTIKVEKIISAIGVVANIENLGLEKTKVKVENGHIKTDPFLKTDEPGVYAIGDVTMGPWLAHKASHEGVICVEKIAGQKDVIPINRSNIPGCTYCYPQIASIGITEQAAKEKGLKVKIGKFPFMANGKAIALGEPDGLVKVIFDEKTGELLGAHMVGAEVTEMIQGFVLGKTLECTEAEIMHTIFPHPTLSEMMHEAVLNAYGKGLHY